MKRKISDLLDDYRAEDVKLGNRNPLSARRIRKRTMLQIQSKRTVSYRWMIRVAVAVAAVMSLMLSVYAADVALNDGKMVYRLFGRLMNEKQAGLVADIGRDFEGSITSNGTVITPIKAMADDNHFYLHLRVEAPEGVVLPDLSEEEWYYYSFENLKPYYYNVNGSKLTHKTERCLKVERYNKEGGHWSSLICDNVTTTLPDENPNDNVKEFVLKINGHAKFSGLNGPGQMRLVFYGLYIQQWGDPVGQEMIAGNFTIDIGINDINRDDSRLVVDAEGYTFYNKEYDFYTTIEKMTITPLTITLEYTHTDPNNDYIFPKGGPIQFVMMDGSTVNAVESYYDAAAHEWPHPDSIVGVGDYTSFDLPVAVKEIDYILVNGEHVIDVN